MIFSILICHIPERAASLKALLKVLNAQKQDNVQILVDDLPSNTIGEKRNRLKERAIGEYLAYIDDDDMVSGDYIPLIVGAINSRHPDCVGFQGEIKGGSNDGWKFRHSITVGRWCKDKHAKIYFRTPNHLNPIKSAIAKQIEFPDSSWGEDREYSDKIKPLLANEAFIEKTIYFYNK